MPRSARVLSCSPTSRICPPRRKVPRLQTPTLWALFLALAFCGNAQVRGESVPNASTGPGQGQVVTTEGSGACGIELFTSDGTYENGYAWQYGGTTEPHYGAFAECYLLAGIVCGGIFDLTQVGNDTGQTMDVFVWEDFAGKPGAVICVEAGVDPGPVAFWPSLSRHEIGLPNCPVVGDFWIGYWGDWPNAINGWFVGADLDGDPGCPFTNITPGIGFPTGWNHVSVAWGPTQSIAIGAQVQPKGEGACCYPDGSCLFQDFVDCEGTILGQDVPCDPNPCPQPTACCFEDGSCVLRTPVDCADEGGGSIPGTACDPNPCTQPVVCCFLSGDCQILQANDCGQDGGVVFPEETSCSPNPCPPPPTGACCFAGGGCVVLDIIECAEIGDFQGEDTSCNPNPCEEPLGACCYPSGTCEIRTESGCGSGGSFLGNGTECSPNPCPAPEPGACCIFFECSQLTESDCLDMNGTFFGKGVGCEPTPCDEPPSGACCLDDGTCLVADQNECTVGGGTFQGEGTGCDPNPCPEVVDGACCLAQGECQVIANTECATSGGSFQGENSTCDPNPCPQPCVAFALNGRVNTELPAPPFNPFAGGGESRLGDGPNRGGTLVLHTNNVVPSGGTEYCGDAAVAGCDEVSARTDEETNVVVHVLALFSNLAEPRLSGLTFGVDFPICVGISEWGSCSDFEIATADWPGPGSGTAVTWGEAQTETVVEVYWFSAYGNVTEPGELTLIEHPTQDALFADDSVPTILDPIAGLGSLGFHRDGIVPCPVLQEALGACCFAEGCQLLTFATCQDQNGRFIGIDVPCEPDPCNTNQGACCLPKGDCEILTLGACNVLGGDYVGDGSVCTSTICPVVRTGACCLADGGCVVLRSTDCSTLEGRFLGEETVCEPFPCPDTGACCFPSGACVRMFTNDCFAAGGQFQGNNVPCDDGLCPTSGACCFEDGSCQLLQEEVCGQEGGIYLDDGITCTPNDCPQPADGACCFVTGDCLFIDIFECLDLQGSYLGDDIVCEPNPCPQPPEGACCFENGDCLILDTFECPDSDGVFQGEDTVCVPNPCPQPEFGACCLPGGSCEELFDFECENVGGTFQGVDTVCEGLDCPISCDDGLVQRSAESPTAGGNGPNEGGTLIIHVDPDLNYTTAEDGCENNSLTACENALVRVDSSDPTVFHVLAAFHPDSSPRMAGVIFGVSYAECFRLEVHGTCADFTLPSNDWPESGAGVALTWSEAQTAPLVPLYFFGGYVNHPTDATRFDLIGHPNGGAVFADDSVPSILDVVAGLGSLGFRQNGILPCPVSAEAGACCLADGSCEVLDEEDCSDVGGVFNGPGTVCDPNPCSSGAPGACCFPDGSCAVVTSNECQGGGGDYQGDGTTCDPNPCSQPTGACCFPDGSCTLLSSGDCNESGGVFQGDGSSCDPNPCSAATGACCVQDGSCIVVTQGECDSDGGDYQGDGVSCDPNPCEVVPTIRSTWGKIKDRFRGVDR